MPILHVARGPYVYVVDPANGLQPSVDLTWDEFVKLVTTFEQRAEKDGPYLCRPMNGNGHRSDANAGAWPLLPCDLDELQPEDVKALHDWATNVGVALVMSTTFSHAPDAPRIRLWIRCSRDVLPAEHPFLQQAFAAIFPFKLDRSTAKPSQPIFLPACPPARASYAFAREYAGKPADVDKLLAGYKALLAQRATERSKEAKGIKTGVRVAGGTIDLFNHHFDLRDLLDAHSSAYKRRTRNRYMYRGSKSGRAAVVLYTDAPEHSLISFHDSDPLAVKNNDGTPRVLDAFATYAILEHNDNFGNAFEGARRWVNERGLGKDESGPAPRSPYAIITLDQIGATLQARDSVVQGMLERECLTLATGDSNSGKTTVLQYMSLCIALGIVFASHPTKRARVLWVAGEDDYNARIRYLALAQKYNVDFRDVKDWLFVLPTRIEVLNEESLQMLHDAIHQFVPNPNDIGAIFLDSKSMTWGGEDENSNDEAATFLQVTKEQLAKQYHAAVVITHHLTKFKDKELQSARGASALINNADHEWRFEKKSGDRIVCLQPGSKLRIAPWAPKNFFIEVFKLDVTDYPQLVDNFGEAPRVSVPELVNAAGVSVSSLEEDYEYAVVLEVIATGKACTKDGKLQVRALARQVLAHPGAATIKAVRDMQTRKTSNGSGIESAEEAAEVQVRTYRDRLDRSVLPKLEEKLLVSKSHRVTEAGERFAGDILGPVREAAAAKADEQVTH